MQTEQAFVTADLMRVISPSCVVVHLESGGVVCAHLRRGMTYAQVFWQLCCLFLLLPRLIPILPTVRSGPMRVGVCAHKLPREAGGLRRRAAVVPRVRPGRGLRALPAGAGTAAGAPCADAV